MNHSAVGVSKRSRGKRLGINALCVLHLFYYEQVSANTLKTTNEDEIIAGESVSTSQISTKSSNLQFVPEFSTILINKKRLSGFGAGLYLNRPIDGNMILSGAIRQAFSRKNDLASLYTALEARILYSLFEYTPITERRLSKKNRPFATISSTYSGGFFVEVSVKQYLFNLKNGVEPYTGIGIGAQYDFFSLGKSTWGLGVGFDRLTNGETALFLLKGTLHIGMLI